jgi:hypothetical protein
VVLGIAAVLLIVDFPEKSTFLTPEEKAWAIDRIERDRGDAVPDKMSWGTIKRDIIDWKIWGFAYLFMSATTGSYACKCRTQPRMSPLTPSRILPPRYPRWRWIQHRDRPLAQCPALCLCRHLHIHLRRPQ